jgi:hypothetical protein
MREAVNWVNGTNGADAASGAVSIFFFHLATIF